MTHRWNVTIELADAEDTHRDRLTTAHAELSTNGTTLHGYGRARRNPADVDVPHIGEELAAARALRDLADRLLAATSDDIAEVEHREIHIRA